MFDGHFEMKMENEGGKLWLVLKPKKSPDIIYYQLNMLVYNNIQGIAPLHVRAKNDEFLFCYEIGQELSPVFSEGKTLPSEMLAVFLEKVLNILSDSRKLLLEEQRFLLNRELIFSNASGDPCLLYYPAEPGYDTLKEFKELVIQSLISIAAKGGFEFNSRIGKLMECLRTPGFNISVMREVITEYRNIASAGLAPVCETAGETGAFSNDICKDITKHASLKGMRFKFPPLAFKVADLVFVLSVQVIAISVSLIADRLFENSKVPPAIRYPFLCAIIIIINVLLFAGILNGREEELIPREQAGEEQSREEKNTGWQDGRQNNRQRGYKKVFGQEINSSGVAGTSYFAGSNPYNAVSPFSAETTLLSEISRKAWLKKSLTDHEAAAELNKCRFVIGRNPEACDLVIPVKTVGRIHAEVISKNGDFYIIDRNSKNGTYLNGQRLHSGQEFKLSSGDSIAFCEEKFYFVF